MIRSLLFVPAKEKMLSKISSLSSDGYIIDLEDSIKEEEKEEALNRLCVFLTENKHIPDLYIRLNKGTFLQEAKALNGFNVGFMLPKFEKVEEYQSLEDIWNLHDVIALIETPIGFLNASSIANCSWINSIAFGAEDFTANMNMENKSDLLLYYKEALVVQAKAFSKKIFDTPSFCISNKTEFEKEVNLAVSLGFDGKMLIHPSHIEYINNSFAKSDMEYLKYVISEYERKGEAVAVIDGKVYEKMHINRFRKILKENKYF